jgi:hypothetical protein
MEACLKCAEGPQGQGGHDDLFTHSFAGANVMMKCRTCGGMWTRKSEDGKTFVWVSTAVSAGALLPQR